MIAVSTTPSYIHAGSKEMPASKEREHSFQLPGYFLNILSKLLLYSEKAFQKTSTPLQALHWLPDPVLHSFFFLPALTSILALLQVKVIQRIYTSKQNTSWTEDLERLMLTLTFNREAPPTETTCYPGMHCSLLIRMESSTNQKDHSKLEPVVSAGGTLHL